MSIYKRNKTWWVQLTAPDGRRIQQTTGTVIKQEAQEYHDRLKSELWRTKNFQDKQVRTWQEVVIRWSSEQGHRKSTRDDKTYLRFVHPYLHNKKLHEIDRELIELLKIEKLKTGVSNSTVNHMLAFIRSVLNKAKNEWEWLYFVPSIKLLPVAKKRIRWITQDEAQRLYRELPKHLKAMTQFSLATGLRESNVTGLLWEQIDMQRHCAWIHADQAKAGKNIAVPLNDDALMVIREQIGKHPINVFTYKGQAIKKANGKAFRNALKRAGIENFRWHDLRHTWASWHVQNGTPLNALQELGGWADYSMVLRYAHLSSDHLKEYSKNVTKERVNNVTNLLQATNKM